MKSFSDHVDAARRELLQAQKLINTEITSYPSPISGCDAQFNHLLAERQKVGEALSALTREVFIPTSRQPMSATETSRQQGA